MQRVFRHTLSLSLLCCFVLPGIVRADATFNLAPVGGIVMASDGRTMIVSVPSEGKLIYIDTIMEKELKQVEVDFQPSLLAIQGKNLFAAVKGSSKIFVLDAQTAKVKKEIALPGEPLHSLGCHPVLGLLYAVNLRHEVFSINPEKGTHQKTKAKGQLLVVDPSAGKFVYTGIQQPIRDVLVIEKQGGEKLKISLVQAGLSAMMLKYEVNGGDLKLVAANQNAAVNGRGMAVSPDGKQVAMAGGGGWRSKTDQRANYAIAVFNTATMDTLNGQIDTGPYPSNIAFHPVLKLGAAFNGKHVILFQSKSFVKKDSFAADDSFNHSGYLLFGGQGTKVIHCSYNAPIEKPSVLQIFSLPLTADDKAFLKKAYAESKDPEKNDPRDPGPKPDASRNNGYIRERGQFAADVNCGESQMVFAPDGDTVIAAGDGALIQWFSLPAGKKVAEIKTGHNGTVVSVSMTPDHKFLATGAIDSTAKVWDLTEKKEVASIAIEPKWSPKVALTPDCKKLFATSRVDIGQWNVAGQKERWSIPAKGIFGLAVSPDGKQAAWMKDNKSVILWDLEKDRRLFELQGHNDVILSVAFSRDSKRLASTSCDRTVRIWDTSQGKELLTLKNHNNPVIAAAFSPDGKTLVSGSGGRHFGLKDNPRLGEVKIWDTATGKQLFHHQGNQPVIAVAYSPNGRWVTASVHDGIMVIEVLERK